MKLHKLALFATVASLAFPAMAQETSAPEDADTASSEAAIIETIEANEYEFDENGKRI